MIYFKPISITGVANKVTFDDGLESSKENPKRLLSVIVQTDEDKGNYVQGWWEREKVFDLIDELLDTSEAMDSTKPAKSFNRLNEIEVGYDIPVGSTFMVALSCGATTNNLRGAYRYEIVS